MKALVINTSVSLDIQEAQKALDKFAKTLESVNSMSEKMGLKRRGIKRLIKWHTKATTDLATFTTSKHITGK